MSSKATLVVLQLAIQLFCLTTSHQLSTTVVSLDGNDWTVTDGKNITVRATVPGGIYTDLRTAGVLKSDPLAGTNDVDFRWVADIKWSFSKDFIAPPDVLTKSRVVLTLEGVDTVANVIINDVLVGTTVNMFVRYQFDIKSAIVAGKNTITVVIDSPTAYALKKNDEYLKSKLYVVPPYCPGDLQHGECHANFIRKMQASFSWDWGPAFPSSGIWKSIQVEAFDQLLLRDIMVTTKYSSKERAWTLDTTLVSEAGPSVTRLPVTVTVQLQSRILTRYNTTLVRSSDGLMRHSALIPVRPPLNFPLKLWWPNGATALTRNGTLKDLGRHLYNLTVTIFPSGQDPTRKTVRVGFRTLELIQDPINGTSAYTFYFKVNGVPIFMKGSNWIPASVFPEQADENYVRHLLYSAKAANMNMLRVWGGGVYESDFFYNLADELGIFIWQDLMFACSLYPTNDEFLATVSDEVTQQVQRLQHHASVAVWAGNNENEVAIAQWWFPELFFKTELYKDDYRKLYISLIKTIVTKEDPDRVFLASSPSNGVESEKENNLASNPQDTRYGDVHFYDYGCDAWDWHCFPSAKFASEYGFQAMPSVASWSKVVSQSDMTYPYSAMVEHRQHHPGGDAEMEILISRHLKLPAHGGVERFGDMIYLSQISQAMSIKTETEFYRRNRAVNANGDGFTMGALYWQLNDVWAAPTWASIEQTGKWKMLHYFALKFFQPIIAVPYIDNGFLKVDAVNDVNSDVPIRLDLVVYKWNTLNPVFKQTIEFAIPKGGVRQAVSEPLSDFLETAKCSDGNQCIARTVVSNDNSSVLHENFLLFGSPKDANGIVAAKIVVTNVKQQQAANGPKIYTVTLKTNALASFVWLDFQLSSNITGEFSENGFFMFEASRTVQLYTAEAFSPESIFKSLTVKSLTDVVTQ